MIPLDLEWKGTGTNSYPLGHETPKTKLMVLHMGVIVTWLLELESFL